MCLSTDSHLAVYKDCFWVFGVVIRPNLIAVHGLTPHPRGRRDTRVALGTGEPSLQRGEVLNQLWGLYVLARKFGEGRPLQGMRAGAIRDLRQTFYLFKDSSYP